jgi:3D (Asp-Asp-Asp) domain-containing protein
MKHILLLLCIVPKVTAFEGVVTIENNNDVRPEIVTLTTYVPNAKETDSTPHITASGFKIDTTNPKKHHIIAVSRDLKKKWGFNRKVRIKRAGKYNGTYVIKDVMNKRFKNRIDIMVGKNDKPIKLSGVQIYAVK